MYQHPSRPGPHICYLKARKCSEVRNDQLEADQPVLTRFSSQVKGSAKRSATNPSSYNAVDAVDAVVTEAGAVALQTESSGRS